ncbi:hypothetical protein K438DRAFT_956322 [Mycena galopus ATCC 62051]|nr:hypothetical protein K438DRAFT_956322 [Mycena galopus ATCC 62051]
MAQVRRETWPIPPAQSSNSRSPGALIASYGLRVQDSPCPDLADILAECKRLKDIADAPPTPLMTFSWLAPYTSRRAPLPALFALPPDLSTFLHTRLSAAFALAPCGRAGRRRRRHRAHKRRVNPRKGTRALFEGLDKF